MDGSALLTSQTEGQMHMETNDLDRCGLGRPLELWITT